MTRKRRQRERDLAREARTKHEAEVHGVIVNFDELAPNNSYSVPPLFVQRGYYVDLPFSCRKCGVSQVWTAEQQRWWYEVAKGNLFSTATLCRPCRRLERECREVARRARMAPNPFKSPKHFLEGIRSALESHLHAAGFGQGGTIRYGGGSAHYFEYHRPGNQLIVSWVRKGMYGWTSGRLLAELLIECDSDIRVVGDELIALTLSKSETECRVASFVTSVQTFLSS